MPTEFKPVRIATIHDVKKGWVNIGDELCVQPKDYTGVFPQEVPAIKGSYSLMDNYAVHGRADWDGEKWINITPYQYGNSDGRWWTKWNYNVPKGN